MKLFECQNCGQLLYFENTQCERCERTLGYLPNQTELSALDEAGDGLWRPLAAPDDVFRFCANAEHDACNWLVPAGSDQSFCQACRLNRTIPNIDDANNLMLWQRLEAAKHQMVYGLMRLGLPILSKFENQETGLAFNFLSGWEPDFTPGPSVITGHNQGLITIDIAEADPVQREYNRKSMVETYRTLLGHFRHEVGHYYWDRLVKFGVWHNAYRETFGDERYDYGVALDEHYANGPPDDWRDSFISAYASAHPWEDFAETWAHYLHIVDTLETAGAFGLRLHATVGQQPVLRASIEGDAYTQTDFDDLMAPWMPLTAAVNSLNNSMGQPDLYPFVLAPTVVGKLRFIHGLIHGKDST